MAAAEAGVDVFTAELGPPGALVPDHDGAATVLALGNDAFEAAVFEGMVFDLDGEAAVVRVVAGAFGDGPTFEDASPAETEVVVEVRGFVLLDDEGKAAGGGGLAEGGGVGGGAVAGGLGGDVEVAHGAVALELRVDGAGGGSGVGAALARGAFRDGFLGGHDGFYAVFRVGMVCLMVRVLGGGVGMYGWW